MPARTPASSRRRPWPKSRGPRCLFSALSAACVAAAAAAADAPPARIVIDDKGVVRIHGDALTISPDGTVSICGGRILYDPDSDVMLQMTVTPDGSSTLRVHVDGTVEVNCATIDAKGQVRIPTNFAGTYFRRDPLGDDLSANLCTRTGVARCENYMMEQPSCGDAQILVVESGKCVAVSGNERQVEAHCTYAECRTNLPDALVGRPSNGAVQVHVRPTRARIV